MNTIINKIEDLINKTPTGENRNELTDINITLHGQLNLCDTCVQSVPSCNLPDVMFGNGRGSDNVVQCAGYQYKS